MTTTAAEFKPLAPEAEPGSLKSAGCYCGQAKPVGNIMCWDCWKAAPPARKRDLRSRNSLVSRIGARELIKWARAREQKAEGRNTPKTRKSETEF